MKSCTQTTPSVPVGQTGFFNLGLSIYLERRSRFCPLVPSNLTETFRWNVSTTRKEKEVRRERIWYKTTLSQQTGGWENQIFQEKEFPDELIKLRDRTFILQIHTQAAPPHETQC